MNYSTYYKWHSINNEVGLKPVYGATGLGKTYGIKECIKEILSGLPNKNLSKKNLNGKRVMVHFHLRGVKEIS
jgi:Cdc6-like AAA superfamily ATPase